MTGHLLASALAWAAAGFSVVPASAGTKAPAMDWKTWQTERATQRQIRAWFTGRDYDGFGLVCGEVSGNTEMLELEGRAVRADLVTALTKAMAEHGLAELWQRLNAGYLEVTPSGGLHWLFRVSGPVRRNLKLARRPATPAELAVKPGERLVVLAETRGEGGYVVIAPSAGRTHPSGRAWVVHVGGPDTVPTITAEERDALHAVVTLFDATPVPADLATLGGGRSSPGPGAGGTRPGDEYNARASWAEVLGPHGWTVARAMGSGHAWRRPGKTDPGISATTGQARDGVDRLYVFSTSTEFESERPYSKFAAYTLLEHGGDYTLAAKTLRARGYGSQPAISAPPSPPARHLSVVLATDGTSARVVDPVPAALPGRHGPTEDGTALALVAAHGPSIRYCPQRGEWLTWTGYRWEWDDAEAVRELVRAIARELPEGEGWATYKKRALSASGVTGILRHAQTDPRVVVHIDTLDARPYELNTPAGIVDLRTGTMLPSDPAAMHTRSTSVAPDFSAPSELFETFLTETFGGDLDLIAFVQRLFGLSAIGAVLEQILPFPQGEGANGKSTLMEVGMDALGRGMTGYAIAAPSEMLMVRNHSEHPAELAQLAGARLVVCSELDDGQRFAEARVKQLTGRDSINARFMRRNPFTFTPSHTLWLVGNHKPAAAAGGPAFWRRVKLLPFAHVVPEDQRDPALGEKLTAQAGAVLAWIIRGAVDYLDGGLRIPKAVEEATSDYATDQDTIGRFVSDACHLAIGQPCVKVPVTALRASYEAWCREVGEEPVSAKRLTTELRARFDVGAERSPRARMHTGICLLDGDAESQGSGGDWWHK